MCNPLLHIWKEMISVSKTWSIKNQMMICYLMTMLIIILLIIFFQIFNLNLLEVSTTNRMEEALDKQARENMLSLIRESGAYIFSKFQEVFIMFDVVGQMLISMYNENTFALEYLTPMRFSSIPASELSSNVSFYEGQNISYSYSCFYNFSSTYDGTLLKKVSRFDNIWKMLLDLTTGTAIRFYILFEEGNFMVIYPASNLPKGYNPYTQIWYTTFIENQNSTTLATTSYKDIIGDGKGIISLVAPLNNAYGQRIGLIVADLPIVFINQEISKISYLNSGQTGLIYKNGDILQSPNTGWWSNKYKNIDQIPDKVFWKQVSSTSPPIGIYYLIDDNVIYRVATYPVMDSAIDSTNWYFLLMLFVSEEEIMEDKNDSQTKIEDFGVILLISTILCSIATMSVVTVCIYFLARLILKPINGVIDFTNKINATIDSEKDPVTLEELNSLYEGEDQVAHLVKAFKSFASNLINRTDDRMPKPLLISQKRIFPPNEFYLNKRLNLRGMINQIRE
ncbi:unnamed protein product [Blepharisma stoltei]|uniref:Cache domain-containing protein n=1 Tax=Blepharisma stoltei TaxID=1481888 RepID=A0AAU9IVV3_9CILI|nr:unnamed protein product [Blepharisma stoltei]